MVRVSMDVIRVASRVIEENETERRPEIRRLPVKRAVRSARQLGGAAIAAYQERRSRKVMSDQTQSSKNPSGSSSSGGSSSQGSRQRSGQMSQGSGPVFAIVSGKNLPKPTLQGAEQSAAGVGQDQQAAALAQFTSYEALQRAAEAEGLTIHGSIQLNESSGWQPFSSSSSMGTPSSNPTPSA